MVLVLAAVVMMEEKALVAMSVVALIVELVGVVLMVVLVVFLRPLPRVGWLSSLLFNSNLQCFPDGGFVGLALVCVQ